MLRRAVLLNLVPVPMTAVVDLRGTILNLFTCKYRIDSSLSQVRRDLQASAQERGGIITTRSWIPLRKRWSGTLWSPSSYSLRGMNAKICKIVWYVDRALLHEYKRIVSNG
eukprot:SAG31_NODE_293_length_18292_cov_8.779586_12_plen_111_part_00